MILPVETEIQTSRLAGIQIREMQVADAPRVAEIEQESSSRPWSAQAIASEIASNRLAVALAAELRGVVCAYLIGWRLEDEAHIGAFAVARAFRQQGLGSFLLERFIAGMKLSGVRKIHLEVRSSNLAAQRLYFKHGFERVGLRKNYYTKEKEDALLLSLYLEEETRDGLV
jgi:ribosomal-protein-alanine N-acetyltransferase